MFESFEKLLESGTKEEIADYIASGHPDPAARVTIAEDLLKMNREDLVTRIRNSTRLPVKLPPKDCPSCNEPMEFEFGCSGKRAFGFLGKYVCYKCLKFELVTREGG